jgi:hypothetical protein
LVEDFTINKNRADQRLIKKGGTILRQSFGLRLPLQAVVSRTIPVVSVTASDADLGRLSAKLFPSLTVDPTKQYKKTAGAARCAINCGRSFRERSSVDCSASTYAIAYRN